MHVERANTPQEELTGPCAGRCRADHLSPRVDREHAGENTCDLRQKSGI